MYLDFTCARGTKNGPSRTFLYRNNWAYQECGNKKNLGYKENIYFSHFLILIKY